MPARSHLSIGEVLSLLREEFPDITISKIRFLESQGLVDPERTPSGYRKFYEHDVERLRWILRQQRENFLPLKVIKGRLTEHGPEAADADEQLAWEVPSGGEDGDARRHEAVAAGVSRPAPAGAATGAPGDDRLGAGSGAPVRSDASALADPAAPGGTAAGRTPGVAAPLQPGAPAGTEAGGAGSGPSTDRRPQAGAAPSRPSPEPSRPSPDLPSSHGSAAGGDPGRSPSPAATPGGDAAARAGSATATANPQARPGQPHDGPDRQEDAPAPQPDGTDRAAVAASPGSPPPAAGAVAGAPGETAGAPAGGGSRRGRAAQGSAAPAGPIPAGPAPGTPEGEVDSYTAAELAGAAGVDLHEVQELQSFGLLQPRSGAGGAAYFDPDALHVVRLAAAFRRHGVEARHLRSWKTSAERESSLFEQVIMPLLHQRNPQARRQALDTLDELAGFGAELREVLLRQALRSVR